MQRIASKNNLLYFAWEAPDAMPPITGSRLPSPLQLTSAPEGVGQARQTLDTLHPHQQKLNN